MITNVNGSRLEMPKLFVGVVVCSREKGRKERGREKGVVPIRGRHQVALYWLEKDQTLLPHLRIFFRL